MVVYTSKINRILERSIMLRTYVNNLAKSVDKCSNDTPSEMRITKGHLDFIYYSQKMMDTNDYNAINDLLGKIGITFKKCKCRDDT